MSQKEREASLWMQTALVVSNMISVRTTMSKIGTNLRTVLSLTLVMLMMGSVMVAELWTRMEKDVKHTTFVQTIIRKIGMKQKIVQRTTLA